MDNNLLQLQGFREMAEKLRQMGPKLARKHLRRGPAAAAAMIRDVARMLAPHDTGEMKKDILVKRAKNRRNEMSATYELFVRSGKKSRASGRSRNVDKDSFYWRFQEFGTSRMAAQPFIRPAFEAEKEEAVKIIGEVLEAGIAEVARERERGQP